MSVLYSLIAGVFFLAAFSGHSIAQEIEALVKSDQDTLSLQQKADIYRKKSAQYQKKKQYESALYAAKKALQHYSLFRSQLDDSATYPILLNIGAVQREAALNYYNLGEYVEAVTYYDKAIKNLKKLTSVDDSSVLRSARKVLAQCYNGKAVIFSYQGDYSKAMKFFLKAAHIYEENDNMTGVAKLYNNIGILQKEQKNYKSAHRYYLKSLSIYKNIEDSAHMASLFNNVGILYTEQKKYDKAFKYLKQAQTINKQVGRKRDLSRTINNFGDVYYGLEMYNNALSYYLRAVSLKKETRNYGGLAEAYLGVARTYFQLRNMQKAIQNAREALDYAKKIGLLKVELETYQLLYKVYKKKGGYSRALTYHEKFKKYNDSLYDKDKMLMANKLQLKYELEQKEQKIKLLNKEKKLNLAELERKRIQSRKQRIIIFTIIGVLLLIIIFAIYIYNRLRIIRRQKSIIQRQKLSMESKNNYLKEAFEEIRQQKEEILVQRDAITEQKERTYTLFSDLKASINYAKYIQNALLPGPRVLNELFKDYFVFFRPHSIVSGDFYWARQVNEWKIIAVADCTGHGVPGALMSMLGITFLNEIVKYEDVKKVSEVLEILRTYIITSLKNKEDDESKRDGMDISLAAYNSKTQKLHFAGANSNMYIIRKTDKNLFCNDEQQQPYLTIDNRYLYLFKGDRMPIGFEEDMNTFTEHAIQMEPRDQIYLYTDGYADQFGGANDKKLKYRPFKELILRNSYKSFAEQQAAISHFFDEWKGTNRQVDDVLVFGGKL